MHPGTLLDTGPLIALLRRDDQYHENAKRLFSKINAPLITCEAVLTESCYILSKFHSKGIEVLLTFINKNEISVDFNLAKEVQHISNLIVKYQSVPISLADACLIRCAEINHTDQIATFDSDFEVYRWGRNRKFKLLS